MNSLLAKIETPSNEVNLIRKKGSTIPFGYKDAEHYEGFYEPVATELEALDETVQYIKNKALSLRDGCDYLYHKTDRKISPAGLMKLINKRYK
tara:strand:- start:206 stop:484 length:279 start_codon:yes stop_codon:yes gene_type:complete